MSSIGKVHLNGSTVLSLNDRFTIMQKQVGGGASAPARPQPRPRARSRSRSRSRFIPQMAATSAPPRISIRNRSLLQQLDHKHKLRVALKLKRKSMKIKPQNAIGVRGRRQLIRPSAALINTTNSRRRLPRSNSVAKQIATIKADLIKNVKRVRRLTQTNTALNLTEQLGVRGRPRLRRNNPVGERAASRSRGRSASRNRANLIRTNSKQNVRGRSASRQRQGAPIHLKRSNSRVNLRLSGQTLQQGAVKLRRHPRNQSRSNMNNVRRNTSINARLGVRRQNNVVQKRGQNPGQLNKQGFRQRQPNKQGLRKIQRGRIIKRNNSNVRIGNGVQQQQPFQQQQQRGRSRSRVLNSLRGQSRIRKGSNQQQQQQQRKQQKRGPNQQRGKQTRGRPQNKTGKRAPPKSKEQLDAELDKYMLNTKSSIDQEMSLYTK